MHIIFFILAAVVALVLSASAATSFIFWDWQWFWETNAGWRVLLLNMFAVSFSYEAYR